MQKVAAQRDEGHRALYWWTLLSLGIQPWQLVFCDETSKRESALRRKRGWGLRGARVTRKEVFHSTKSISVLALYGISGFIDFDCVEGGYSSDDFIEAFQFMIIPHLQPGMDLVLDNCGIHHAFEDEMKAMAAAVGARILFLAPYSSIDNPIELAFNVFKIYWIRNSSYFSQLEMKDAVRECLFNCYPNPHEAALASYRHCGYNA